MRDGIGAKISAELVGGRHQRDSRLGEISRGDCGGGRLCRGKPENTLACASYARKSKSMRATSAGADQYALYEITKAREYEHKAREEIGYAQYQMAMQFADAAVLNGEKAASSHASILGSRHLHASSRSGPPPAIIQQTPPPVIVPAGHP